MKLSELLSRIVALSDLISDILKALLFWIFHISSFFPQRRNPIDESDCHCCVCSGIMCTLFLKRLIYQYERLLVGYHTLTDFLFFKKNSSNLYVLTRNLFRFPYIDSAFKPIVSNHSNFRSMPECKYLCNLTSVFLAFFLKVHVGMLLATFTAINLHREIS